METIIDVALYLFMGVLAVGIVRLHGLFAVVMLTGLYSLVSASLFVHLDAVDVAFTEAAVGAGISTVLMLGTLALVGADEKPSGRNVLPALLAVSATGALLVLATLDMPAFGDPAAPIHHHVADHYLTLSAAEVGPPNVVTSVLASYRGYDTLGETTVILTAAVGVLALLGRTRRGLPRRLPQIIRERMIERGERKR